MQKTYARSRLLKYTLKARITRAWKQSSIRPLIILPLFVFLAMKTQGIVGAQVLAPTENIVYVDRAVEVIREVEVDRTFTSEHQQILAYIVEKFGDRADDAIAMINQCENSTFNTEAMNHNVQQSGRRSFDVGVFQMNVDEDNTAEIEKLKDWKYNIDRAYDKYHAKNNTFYFWTCGYTVKDRTYLNAIRGE